MGVDIKPCEFGAIRPTRREFPRGLTDEQCLIFHVRHGLHEALTDEQSLIFPGRHGLHEGKACKGKSTNLWCYCLTVKFTFHWCSHSTAQESCMPLQCSDGDC